MKILIILLITILFTTSCENKGLTDAQVKNYTIKGKEIGKATVKLLGSNLMKNMKMGGPKQAVPFCNTAAAHLTDEVANKYNVSIKRTSHKLRSEKNKASTAEKQILEHYLSQLKKGEKLKPIVKKENDEKIHFYAPIKLEAKCLACHGSVGKEVNVKTDSILKALYPNDKATGFKVGDLRGIVNIMFNE